MANRLLLQLAGAVGIIGLIILLWFSGATARAERDMAKQNYQVALHANATLEATMDELRREQARLEAMIIKRESERRELERYAAEQIRERDARLAQLESEHEAVSDFLAIPVPADFVDGWMRKAGSRTDRSN